MAEQVALEPGFQLARCFRLEVGVAGIVGDQPRRIGSRRRPHLGKARHRRRKRLKARRGAGLHAVRSVGAAQPEGVQPAELREERLVGRDPRHAQLWIDDLLEVGSKRAVLVLPRRRRDEQPVVHAQLLLGVVAERLHRRGLRRRERGECRRSAQRRRTGREPAPGGGQGVGLHVGVVAADRRLEVHPRARLPGGRAGGLRRETCESRASGRTRCRCARWRPSWDTRSAGRCGTRRRPARSTPTVPSFCIQGSGRQLASKLPVVRCTSTGVMNCMIEPGANELYSCSGKPVGSRKGLSRPQPAVLGSSGAALVAVVRLAHVQQRDEQRVVRLDRVVRLGESCVGREVELGAQLRRQVRAEVELLLIARVEHGVGDGRVQGVLEERLVLRRHLDRSILVVEIAADEKAHGVRCRRSRCRRTGCRGRARSSYWMDR